MWVGLAQSVDSLSRTKDWPSRSRRNSAGDGLQTELQPGSSWVSSRQPALKASTQVSQFLKTHLSVHASNRFCFSEEPDCHGAVIALRVKVTVRVTAGTTSGSTSGLGIRGKIRGRARVQVRVEIRVVIDVEVEVRG